MFTAFAHTLQITESLEGYGVGWMTDANIMSVVWAMFAAAAGFSLSVAAIAFWRRALNGYFTELDASYNALATQVR